MSSGNGIGQICGDQCLIWEGDQCQCGYSEPFEENDGYYCCVPKNETCIDDWGVMKCPSGIKLAWNEMCSFQNQCPVDVSSAMAISSNCNSTENNHCPSGRDVSKVCTKSEERSVEKFCDSTITGGKVCPKTNGGLKFTQCYYQ